MINRENEQEKSSEDKLWLSKILVSSKNQHTILFRIARHIENKYNLPSDINYWDNDFKFLTEKEKLFYKTWLWFNYVQNESNVPPILEVKQVFCTPIFEKLWERTEIDYNAIHLIIDEKAGKYLIEWVKEHLYEL
jgi:hypothetical protein